MSSGKENENDLDSKKKYNSISNSKENEILAYQKELPKQVSRALSTLNDSYDDLTKTEHESIESEMRNSYISFTSKFNIHNSENELNLVSNNGQQSNDKESRFISSTFNEDEDNTKGISFVSVPLTSANEIITRGDIVHENSKSTEELLKHIHEHDAINNNSIHDSNNNINDDISITIIVNNDDNNNNNNIIDNNKNNNIIDNNNNNDNDNDNDNDNNDSSDIISSSLNEPPVRPRRKSSVFQALFQRSRHNSTNQYQSQHSISPSTSTNSIFKSNTKDPSISQLVNITEGSQLSPYIIPSNNNDINDLLNIGVTSPITENSLTDNLKKRKSRKCDILLSNIHDMDEVFKQPNIEFIGRTSCENNVINVYIAEKVCIILKLYIYI